MIAWMKEMAIKMTFLRIVLYLTAWEGESRAGDQSMTTGQKVKSADDTNNVAADQIKALMLVMLLNKLHNVVFLSLAFQEFVRFKPISCQIFYLSQIEKHVKEKLGHMLMLAKWVDKLTRWR